MARLVANDSGISPGLLFALLGSLLLHIGLLFWAPALPAGTYTSRFIEARLVYAPPLVAVSPNKPRVRETDKVARLTSDIMPKPVIRMTPETSRANSFVVPELHGEPPAMVVQSGAVDLPDPTYYSIEQLDVSPHLQGEIRQIYPAKARNAGIEGFVTLSLLINERGEVDDIQVAKSQPAGFFEEAAISALRGHRFTPGIRQGRAVRSNWQKTLHFKLQD